MLSKFLITFFIVLPISHTASGEKSNRVDAKIISNVIFSKDYSTNFSRNGLSVKVPGEWFASNISGENGSLKTVALLGHKKKNQEHQISKDNVPSFILHTSERVDLKLGNTRTEVIYLCKRYISKKDYLPEVKVIGKDIFCINDAKNIVVTLKDYEKNKYLHVFDYTDFHPSNKVNFEELVSFISNGEIK